MSTVLDVSHLTKTFITNGIAFTAVNDITFSVKEGEVVGLLGPNGAGKSTTIQMLLNLTIPTSGSIKYFGKTFSNNAEYILSRINFASAFGHIQGRMTVLENFTIYGKLYDVPYLSQRIEELFELFDIEGFSHQKFWQLSSGQQTRVILAKALLNKPRLLLLDEPTAALDPEIVDKVLTLIEKLRKEENTTILYTSHHMNEVERICDRVIFMSHGRIVAEDTPLGLTKKVGKARLIITFDGEREVLSQFLESEKMSFSYSRRHVVEIEVEESDIPKILFGLAKQKVWMTDIDIQKPGLEEVFLSIAQNTYENS